MGCIRMIRTNQKQTIYLLLLLIPGALSVSATLKNFISLVYTARHVDAAPSLSISILILGLTFLSVIVILTTIVTAGGYDCCIDTGSNRYCFESNIDTNL